MGLSLELIVADTSEPPVSQKTLGGSIISGADGRTDRVTADACAPLTR